MREWEKHIVDNHADHQGRALCGAELASLDWKFHDLDHAFNSIRSGSRTIPCPACRKAVLKIFAFATEEPET